MCRVSEGKYFNNNYSVLKKNTVVKKYHCNCHYICKNSDNTAILTFCTKRKISKNCKRITLCAYIRTVFIKK